MQSNDDIKDMLERLKATISEDRRQELESDDDGSADDHPRRKSTKKAKTSASRSNTDDIVSEYEDDGYFDTDDMPDASEYSDDDSDDTPPWDDTDVSDSENDDTDSAGEYDTTSEQWDADEAEYSDDDSDDTEDADEDTDSVCTGVQYDSESEDELMLTPETDEADDDDSVDDEGDDEYINGTNSDLFEDDIVANDILPSDGEEDAVPCVDAIDIEPEDDTSEAMYSDDTEDHIPLFLTKKMKRRQQPEPDEAGAEPDEQPQPRPKKEKKPPRPRRPLFYGLHRMTDQFGGGYDDCLSRDDSDRARSLLLNVLRQLRLTALFTILVGIFTFASVWWEGSPRLVQELAQILGMAGSVRFSALIDMLLLLVPMLCFIPETVRSIRALREQVVTPAFCVFAVSSASMLYTLVSLTFGLSGMMAALPASALILMALLCRLFYLGAVSSSAQIVLHSRGGTALKLRDVDSVEHIRVLFENYGKCPSRMLSTGGFADCDGFFARLGTIYVGTKVNVYHLAASAASALICFGINFDLGTMYAIGSGLVSLCTTMPVSLLLLHTYTLMRLSSKLKKARMAVAGEDSVFETSEADVLCYSDTYAFPRASTSIIKIKHCSDSRLDRMLSLLTALFAKIGGPLDGQFSVRGDSVLSKMKVKLTEITDDGVSAVIDGTEIRCGKGAYMEKYDIAFYYDSEDEEYIEDHTTSVLFVACDGVGCGKLYIKYTISDEFTRQSSMLARKGVYTVIRSCDPAVNQRMIDRIPYVDRGSVVAVSAGTPSTAEPVDSGTVAYGVKPENIYPVRFLYSAYRSLLRLLPLFSLLTVPLCCLLTCAISRMGETAVTPLAVMCQVLSALPSVLAVEATFSKHHIGEHTDDK